MAELLGAEVEVRGLREVEEKMTQVATDIAGPEFTKSLRRATLLVSRDAKKFAPVDVGPLRSSITGTIVVRGKVIHGVVGSKLKYAPYMELGTKPHWPPIAALETWARRHGMNAFLVARAISIHGTKPRLFLERAFQMNKRRIESMLSRAVSDIVAEE